MILICFDHLPSNRFIQFVKSFIEIAKVDVSEQVQMLRPLKGETTEETDTKKPKRTYSSDSDESDDSDDDDDEDEDEEEDVKMEDDNSKEEEDEEETKEEKELRLKKEVPLACLPISQWEIVVLTSSLSYCRKRKKKTRNGALMGYILASILQLEGINWMLFLFSYNTNQI